MLERGKAGVCGNFCRGNLDGGGDGSGMGNGGRLDCTSISEGRLARISFSRYSQCDRRRELSYDISRQVGLRDIWLMVYFYNRTWRMA